MQVSEGTLLSDINIRNWCSRFKVLELECASSPPVFVKAQRAGLTPNSGLGLRTDVSHKSPGGTTVEHTAVETVTDLVSFFAGSARKLRDRGAPPAKGHAFPSHQAQLPFIFLTRTFPFATISSFTEVSK